MELNSRDIRKIRRNTKNTELNEINNIPSKFQYNNIKGENNMKIYYHMTLEDLKNKDRELLSNIKSNLPELEELLNDVNSDWYEDFIYRYYHHSWKVFDRQFIIRKIVKILEKIKPLNTSFCDMFIEDVVDIVIPEKEYNVQKYNRDWRKYAKPILDAFFYAKYFLEMTVKYGKELDGSPDVLPYGYAALATLYGIR